MSWLSDFLFGKKVEAPPPPDYAGAVTAGVNADLASLPLRNAINAASQLGKVYTDPTTGKVYDFTGLGTADINAADLAKQLEMAPQTTQLLLDLQKQFGTQFAEEARKQLMATDPTGFNLREQFGKTLGSGANSIESMYSGVNAPQYEQMGVSGPGFERLSGAPGMERVGGAQLSDTGAAAAGRAALETQTFDELSRVQSGAIDPALMAATQQAVRARGAANGSALGDANALQESLAVQLAGQQRADQVRGNAQSLLTSGQTTSDKANALTQGNFENSLARAGFNNAAGQQEFQNKTTTTGFNNQAADTEFQNAMSAINQRNQAKQNQFAGEQGLVGQRASARQQDTANLQSFLGLQPLVSQGGQLAGLQQGAAPFLQNNAYNATGANGSAGQQGAAFAGNIFGTQGGIFGAQSAANSNRGFLNAWGQVTKGVGNIAGAGLMG